MALARWASVAGPKRNFLFLSNFGHEIGHMGIHHLFERDVLPPPESTDLWLHLGSSIGTVGYDEDKTLLRPNGPDKDSWLFSSQDLIAHLQQSFSDLPHLELAV